MKPVSLILGLVLIGGSAWGGPSSGGGGDEFTLDFVSVATEELYPWLKQHGHKLNPKVNAEEFLAAVDPMSVSSVDRVFESCNGTAVGREVQACYDSLGNKFLISRSLYPLAKPARPSKLGLVAHEIFRKMGIEGDLYEVSRQLAFVEIPSSLHSVQNGTFAPVSTEYQACILESDGFDHNKNRAIPHNETDFVEQSTILNWRGQEMTTQITHTRTSDGSNEKIIFLKTGEGEIAGQGTVRRRVDESIFAKSGGELKQTSQEYIREITADGPGSYIDRIFSSANKPLRGAFFVSRRERNESSESFAEIREPGPIDEDGIQVLNVKYSCLSKKITRNQVEATGMLKKITTQIGDFDHAFESHQKNIHDLSSCLTEIARDCSEIKVKVGSSRHLLERRWSKIIAESNFREKPIRPAPSPRNRRDNSNNSGDRRGGASSSNVDFFRCLSRARENRYACGWGNSNCDANYNREARLCQSNYSCEGLYYCRRP